VYKCIIDNAQAYTKFYNVTLPPLFGFATDGK
jgi:hypothetical protein